MGNKIQAVVKQRFSAAPERVYDAWLSEEMVRVWLAASLRECGLAGDLKRIEIDARLGGKFFFSDQRGEVEAGADHLRGLHVRVARHRGVQVTTGQGAGRPAEA